ncbi:UNVERIFIED_CONTAM: hypothetical protein PYX00_007457 [Menopon gallinae]|uniref:Uncharacterized protein n=1 Tax=Menopon gallinae TaxID=328185 RepID=A0AAW2HK50_9NEOP
MGDQTSSGLAGKMIKAKLLTILFLLLLDSLCSAQITFSKDWNAGKRSVARGKCIWPGNPKFDPCDVIFVRKNEKRSTAPPENALGSDGPKDWDFRRDFGSAYLILPII